MSEKKSSFYKDEQNRMFCVVCNEPVVWRQTKEGKWYLAVAELQRVNVSSRNVEKYVDKVVSGKQAHFRVCEDVVKRNKRAEQEFSQKVDYDYIEKVRQEVLKSLGKENDE